MCLFEWAEMSSHSNKNKKALLNLLMFFFLMVIAGALVFCMNIFSNENTFNEDIEKNDTANLLESKAAIPGGKEARLKKLKIETCIPAKKSVDAKNIATKTKKRIFSKRICDSDGNPIEGAKVKIYKQTRNGGLVFLCDVITDKDGRFSYEISSFESEEGIYCVIFAPGMLKKIISTIICEINRDEKLPDDIKLETGATIIVTVRNLVLNYIEGIEVVAYYGGGGKTSAEGKVELVVKGGCRFDIYAVGENIVKTEHIYIAAVTGETYEVELEIEAYPPKKKVYEAIDITVIDSNDTPLSKTILKVLAGDLDIEIVGSHNQTMDVNEKGEYFEQSYFVTNEKGQVRFFIEPGRYKIGVRIDENYLCYPKIIQTKGKKSIQVVKLVKVEIKLINPKDNSEIKPDSGWFLVELKSKEKTFEKSDGNIFVEAGNYDISVNDISNIYPTIWKDISINKNNKLVRLKLKPGILKGKVTAKSSKPIVFPKDSGLNSYVSIHNEKGGITSYMDEKGNFKILSVPSGRFRIKGCADGYYDSKEIEFIMLEGETKNIDIELEKATTVTFSTSGRLRVANENGWIKGDYFYQVFDKSGQTCKYHYTFNEGKYIFCPYVQSFVYHPSEYDPKCLVLNLKRGEQRTVKHDFTLKYYEVSGTCYFNNQLAQGSIRFHRQPVGKPVVLKNGENLPPHRIWRKRDWIYIDSNGSFVTKLPIGNYKIEFLRNNDDSNTDGWASYVIGNSTKNINLVFQPYK